MIVLMFGCECWICYPPDQTSLFWASKNGHLSIVRHLLDMKANVDSADKYGATFYGLVVTNRTPLRYPEVKKYGSSIVIPYPGTRVQDCEIRQTADLIKQRFTEARIRVFSRDLACVHVLGQELERALGGSPVRRNEGRELIKTAQAWESNTMAMPRMANFAGSYLDGPTY